MNFQNDKDGDRRRKPDAESGAERMSSDTPKNRKRRLPATDVGDALKSAYDRTLHEDIPPEMLDLLGKLG